MTRPHPALLLAGLLISSSLSASCSDRLGDYEREPDNRVLACVPISVSVQTQDGSMWLLDEDLRHPWWCTCIMEDEIDEELWSWVNERAYSTCVDFVEELGHDPALSTCLSHYEEQDWGGGVFDSLFDELQHCSALGALPPRTVVE